MWLSLKQESKFKSKVAADNIKAQNLLMKRNQEKKLESSKTSTSKGIYSTE